MTVGVSKMKIQGIASCHYLCMDSCGLLYGSQEFEEECIFNEIIEPDHYNTYSSAKYSNERRTFYLALNRRGQPRKVLLRSLQPLGRLSSYVRVLIRTISNEKSYPIFSSCPQSNNVTTNTSSTEINSSLITSRQYRCRWKKKRKISKKKKCAPTCHAKKIPRKRKRLLQFKFRKKCLLENEEDCRAAVSIGKKKKKKKKLKKISLKINSSLAPEIDDDYTVESTTPTPTHWDWDYSTATTEELSTSYTD